VLGVAQGCAEVVPVSSSAQLVLLPYLLGWEHSSEHATFAAALHAGSCLGIGWVLRDEVRSLDLRTAGLLAGTCLPPAVAGYLIADRVEERLRQPAHLATVLAAAGALLWAVDRRAEGHQRGVTVGARQAALASFAQIPALAPGVSRSGATLTALRASGVDRAPAERFSLLMSLPVTAGAALLTLARTDRRTLRALGPSLAAGAGCAAVAGAAAARALQRRPGRPATGPTLYRLALAAAVARRIRTTGKDRW
jgi:undecaprenyl-diphosphatase